MTLKTNLAEQKPFAQPSRWLKHSTVSAASGQVDGAGQNAGLFGADQEVEGMAAAAVLARDAVNDSTGFLLHR